MQRSPFYELHLQHHAVMGNLDGWEMPHHYGDSEQEYAACEQGLGVYDMSHYSRVRVKGAMVNEILGELCDDGVPEAGCQIKTMMECEEGKVPLWIQHQDKGVMLISPPSDWAALERTLQERGGKGISIEDETKKTAMVGLCGPNAVTMLEEKLPVDLPPLTAGTVVCKSIFFIRIVLTVASGDNAWLIMPAKMATMGLEVLNKYGQQYQAQLVGWDAVQRREEGKTKD